jgi:predicted NACHT family NTPase
MEALTTALVDYVGNAVVQTLGKLLSGTEFDALAAAGRLRLHLIEAASWSEHVQLFGAAEPLDTDTVTVRLRLLTGARKLSANEDRPERTEEDLVVERAHFLVLGQPGAGKTTTLKRITRKLLFEEPARGESYDYPLVLRLREIPDKVSLIAAIVAILGITAAKKLPSQVTIEKPDPDMRGLQLAPDLFIGELSLQQFVVEYLESTNAVLLLDGLDEVELSRRRDLQAEIVQLGMLLRHSKIIVTCRTGDYQRIFDGFRILEVCPLVLLCHID